MVTHVAAITNPGRMVTQPAADFWVGGLNPCQPTVVVGTAAMFARPGFEPPTKKSAVGCITIRPLCALGMGASPLLGAASATDKKTQPVCFCLTDCWPG